MQSPELTIGFAIDFYSTTAQVIPVLLLALGWGSDFLRDLRGQTRCGYRIWKKPVIRAWGTSMALVSLAAEGAVILVLADLVGPGSVVKGLAITALAALSITVTWRMIVDIHAATKPPVRSRRVRVGPPS